MWTYYSEAKERALANVLVGTNLDSEAVPFTFPNSGGGERIQKASMAFVPNLVAKVTQKHTSTLPPPTLHKRSHILYMCVLSSLSLLLYHSNGK